MPETRILFHVLFEDNDTVVLEVTNRKLAAAKKLLKPSKAIKAILVAEGHMLIDTKLAPYWNEFAAEEVENVVGLMFIVLYDDTEGIKLGLSSSGRLSVLSKVTFDNDLKVIHALLDVANLGALTMPYGFPNLFPN